MIDLARQTRAFCPFRGNEMGRALFSPISEEEGSLLICHGEMERIRGSGSLKMNGSFFSFFFFFFPFFGRKSWKLEEFLPH